MAGWYLWLEIGADISMSIDPKMSPSGDMTLLSQTLISNSDFFDATEHD